MEESRSERPKGKGLFLSYFPCKVGTGTESNRNLEDGSHQVTVCKDESRELAKPLEMGLSMCGSVLTSSLAWQDPARSQWPPIVSPGRMTEWGRRLRTRGRKPQVLVADQLEEDGMRERAESGSVVAIPVRVLMEPAAGMEPGDRG